MKPFETRKEASRYDAAAEDQNGGWWGLGYQCHPNGTDLYHVGRPDRMEDVLLDKVEEKSGWPKTLKHRHLLVRANDGSKCIVRDDSEPEPQKPQEPFNLKRFLDLHGFPKVS